MQGGNGTWQHSEIGPTALAGLTLLECGAGADDKDVRRAADAVRPASLRATQTYSISLSILFLDRLGDSADVPLIESLVVRLLAGQDASGGWSYSCPAIGEGEVRRLQAWLDKHKERSGRREPPTPGAAKRTVKDLPEEIQRQLLLIERGAAGAATGPVFAGGDNSNTQFATIALWVGRRYGLPVERAALRIGTRFRSSQNADGGWSYTMSVSQPGMASTASMTCAGLLGLTVADAAALELLKQRKPAGRKLPDLGKDVHLTTGLTALGSVIGNPRNLRLNPFDPPNPDLRVGGRTYYFLWSLERVAVALDLPTLGKKDWYAWGAEILLANQKPDGSWSGDYGTYGADTCFALLFLKRANLVTDLTVQLKGQLRDPGEREIRGGGIGGDSLRGVKPRAALGHRIHRRQADPQAVARRPMDGHRGRPTGGDAGEGLGRSAGRVAGEDAR